MQRGDDGFELGAATVNVMLVLAALVVTAGVSVVITYPDVATLPLISVLGVVAVLLPIVLYPFSFTIWFAIELLMDPPSAKALAEAEQRVADGSLTKS